MQCIANEGIGDKQYSRLTVPPKIWFGFKGIGKPESIILNLVNVQHNPKEILRCKKNKIKAIIPVHLGGQCIDNEKIYHKAKKKFNEKRISLNLKRDLSKEKLKKYNIFKKKYVFILTHKVTIGRRNSKERLTN